MSTPSRLVNVVTVPISFWLIRGHAAVMSSAGFDVHAISSPGPQADEYSRDQNVPVHPVPMARRIAPWSDLVSLARLVATLKRLRPRLVQAGTPKAGLLGMIAAHFLRVPIRIYYLHGLPMLTAQGLQRLILRTTERLACAMATHVVCVSHSIRHELVTAGLCPFHKAIVLGDGSSNGVDTRWFDRRRLPGSTRKQVRFRLGIPQNALVVGFVGRIGHRRQVEFFGSQFRFVVLLVQDGRSVVGVRLDAGFHDGGRIIGRGRSVVAGSGGFCRARGPFRGCSGASGEQEGAEGQHDGMNAQRHGTDY